MRNRWHLLAVVGILLLVSPVFIYPNGGLATYEYTANSDDLSPIESYADHGAYERCTFDDSAVCLVVRNARDGGTFYANTTAELPGLVRLVDRNHPTDRTGTARYYWVETTVANEGLSVTTRNATNLTTMREYVSTPVTALPEAPRRALAGNPLITTTEHERAYLVRHEGEWVSLERRLVRRAGVPVWASRARFLLPVLGAFLLGKWFYDAP